MAQDGVSCSLCHQISKDKLGTRESLVGGFVVDTARKLGEREEYGPYKIENGQNRIMRIFDRRIQAYGVGSHPQVGIVRDLSHADHQRRWGPAGR